MIWLCSPTLGIASSFFLLGLADVSAMADRSSPRMAIRVHVVHVERAFEDESRSRRRGMRAQERASHLTAVFPSCQTKQPGTQPAGPRNLAGLGGQGPFMTVMSGENDEGLGKSRAGYIHIPVRLRQLWTVQGGSLVASSGGKGRVIWAGSGEESRATDTIINRINY